MSSNSNTVVHISGSKSFTSPHEIVTQDDLKDSLYRAFNEMSQEDCAKILYACLTKMLSDEKREELETFLKMCNNYQTVVKQIIKL